METILHVVVMAELQALTHCEGLDIEKDGVACIQICTYTCTSHTPTNTDSIQNICMHVHVHVHVHAHVHVKAISCTLNLKIRVVMVKSS